ncbi:MAG: VanZ family protein [Gemmatimonadales bacterium]
MSHGGRGDRAGAGLLVLVSLAVIALTTLRANPSQLDRVAETAWTCLVCGDAGTTDVLLNLLLFAPLGVGLRWRGWSGGRAVLAICLLTLAIEGTQAFALAGRDATISDVLANSLGGAIGWWGWPRLVGWSRSRGRRGAAGRGGDCGGEHPRLARHGVGTASGRFAGAAMGGPTAAPVGAGTTPSPARCSGWRSTGSMSPTTRYRALPT